MVREKRVGEYVKRGHGAIFSSPTGRHGDNPLELAKWASQRHPDWFRPWLERVRQIGEGQIAELFKKMPPRVFSAAAGDFCQCFINYTLNELKGIQV